MTTNLNRLIAVASVILALVGCSKSEDEPAPVKPTSSSNITALPEFQQPTFIARVDAGTVCERYKIDTLFGTRQYVTVTQFKPSQSSLKMEIATASPSVLFEKTSAIATRMGAAFAINGSYFDGVGNPSFWLKVNDKITNPNGGPATERGEGVFYIDNSNGAHIAYRPSDFSAINNVAKFGFGCGPMLLVGGVEQPNDDPTWNGATRARTAVGIRSNGDILFVIVDETLASDATSVAVGITVQQMGKLLKRLGCVDAINFDGGGSSVMYIKGYGAITCPSDGSSDNSMLTSRERSVQNILMLI